MGVYTGKPAQRLSHSITLGLDRILRHALTRREKVGCRTAGYERTVVDDEQPGAGCLDLLQDVGTEQHCSLLAQFAHQVPDVDALVGVEPFRGLIEHQNFGMVKDRCRKPDPLPVSFRQLRHRAKEHLIDARLVHRVGDSGPRRSRGEQTKVGGVLQVLDDQHLLIKRIGFRQISQALLGGREVLADRHLVVENAALIRLERARQHPHSRRLAGTVGSEKSDDLAPVDLEVEVSHGDELTESFGHTLNGDHSFPSF